jgi:hypothetical protein
MGRLRQLSASFKAAANNSTFSIPSLSKTSTNGQTQIVDKDSPTHSGIENSPTPTGSPRTPAQADRAASRPISMVYTPPLMDFERDNHVEELRPVFRCANRRTLNPLSLVLTALLVSYQATATNYTKKVGSDYLHVWVPRC